jgi:hypothetical protein
MAFLIALDEIFPSLSASQKIGVIPKCIAGEHVAWNV